MAMRPQIIFGVLLIAIGIAGLLIDNIPFSKDDVVVEAGPIKVTESRQHPIPVPSIAGVIAIVVGAGLLFVGRQARS
jgi:hypothetical protein